MQTSRHADHIPARRLDQVPAGSPRRRDDNASCGRAPGPLDGIRVLDLGTVYAAPITAMILGDFGADVLKIEHPRGDPARSHGYSKDGHGLWWKVIARNKRAITLNLSRPAGRELLEGLAAEADVVIENFRPGVMEKWGLGPGRLHEVNPALVILRVTGFGQFGPSAKRRAFGTLAEAMTGFAHQRGSRMGRPHSRRSGWLTASPASPGRSRCCWIPASWSTPPTATSARHLKIAKHRGQGGSPHHSRGTRWFAQYVMSAGRAGCSLRV